MKSRRQIALILAFLLAVLGGAMLLSTALGSESIPFSSTVKMTLNKLPLFHFEPSWPPVYEDIVFHLRLPRVVGGALVGAALAAAGVLFQGLLRNPLADPYIIGTSSGAFFGISLAMIFLPLTFSFFGFGITSITAFCGSLGAVFLVYNLARIGGRTPVVSMVLAGFVVGAFLTAIAWFLLSVSGDLHQRFNEVFSFLMGGIRVSNWQQVTILAPLILVSIALSLFFVFHLNAFSLGEEGAAYVGVDVERDKLLILTLGALLTASAVCIGGLIGFVGLVIPHVTRLALGPDHRLLLPASVLAGASFLVLADLAARIAISPQQLHLGILTALIGAPVFIYLLRRYRKEYAF